MRIALVLHDASPEPDGAPLFPTVALERDGALYRVSALARAFGRRYEALTGEVDFHCSIVSLSAEPLRELDERLKSGERPASARILPGTFTWLAPCDPERASVVFCDASDAVTPGSQPRLSIGSARVLFGHEATVPLPCDASEPIALAIQPSLAVVLGEEISCATEAEAKRAILGYSLLLAYRPGLRAQLGPVLVTRDEAGDLNARSPCLRIGGVTLRAADLGVAPLSIAEVIAWVSYQLPLCAGDVIALTKIGGDTGREAAAPLDLGVRVELSVPRLGRLAGRAVLGPAPSTFRPAGV